MNRTDAGHSPGKVILAAPFNCWTGESTEAGTRPLAQDSSESIYFGSLSSNRLLTGMKNISIFLPPNSHICRKHIHFQPCSLDLFYIFVLTLFLS